MRSVLCWHVLVVLMLLRRQLLRQLLQLLHQLLQLLHQLLQLLRRLLQIQPLRLQLTLRPQLQARTDLCFHPSCAA